MASTKRSVPFPPLRPSTSAIADSGKLRLGDGSITAEFPTLRLPDHKIADSGKVRLGDGSISGQYPLKR